MRGASKQTACANGRLGGFYPASGALAGWRRGRGVEIEAGEHEIDQRLPALEVEITGQGLHIIKEGLAGGTCRPPAAVGFVSSPVASSVIVTLHQLT